ncbi:CaiB/BaiF CoA transferase family protein [Sapientia aquatica]|uniref:CoA transferase n=1 Tax=Sapientia aquatica TaxID=1549640 RepID=A0A4R5W1X4_9BURK|nr:CoA transferase [Sapientia aquatica]TDK65647.1 CoA transferase [Sapientia aquatica]
MDKNNKTMLEGIRIADMSNVIFGPYCTQILSDLGAEVIKVEASEGDSVRLIGTPAKTPFMGPVHMRVNRGKRSVAWNLKSEFGQTAIRRLLATSDVFIHNTRSEAANRLGLDYETVRAIRPDIIYVHCTGFDTRGPYAGLQAYDDIIQSASGMASLLPRVDGNPQPRFFPMAVADKVSGLHGVYAVLAAIIHRLRTGEGQRVEVPMFEVMASFNLTEHLCDLSFVPPTGPSGYTRQLDPVRQPLKTKDGYISIAPYLDDRWVRFFVVAGHQEVLQDERLIDAAARRKNTDLMYQLLAQIAQEKTTKQWLQLLKVANIPAMHINSLEDLLKDPQLKATGLFQERVHPTEGNYIEVNSPVRFSRQTKTESRHAPTIGEHSEEVELELGLANLATDS